MNRYSVYSLERLLAFLLMIENDTNNIYHFHIFINQDNYTIVICKYDKGKQVFIGGVIVSENEYNNYKDRIESTNCFISIE